ncbi:hypothetical protein ACFL2S_07645 [Thermodesulfobacteriota bacterium]
MEKDLYNNYPGDRAKREFEKGQKKRFRMTTIYFRYSERDRRRSQGVVQKAVYDMTLAELVKWIKEQPPPEGKHFRGDYEDIVSIETFPD